MENRKIIGGKNYIVKAVFTGEKDIKTIILNLAERNAIREMGLDIPLDFKMHNAS